MARHVTAQVRLQVTGGQATPAPPVGPALGQHGVNIGAFVSQFNDRTKEMRGITVPVVITVYSDRSFEFIVKSPPAAVLLKQAAGIPLEKKKGGEVAEESQGAQAEGRQGQGFPRSRGRRRAGYAAARRSRGQPCRLNRRWWGGPVGEEGQEAARHHPAARQEAPQSAQEPAAES